MKKLFKKSIALVLSAALCLTALIGCLTVSADGTATTETTKPAFILGTASGKAGETVNLDGSVTVISGISAHDVSFTFPAGFEVLSVSGAPGLVNGDELNGTESNTPAPASETSENSNYVKDQDYTEETVDGKTVIRFVDVYQLDAAATYGIRFSVKIPSDATVGDQTVAIEAKVAKDKTTENTETLLPAADITVTAGKITVASSEYSVYTSAKFNVSTGVVSIERAAFSDEAWSEVLAAAKKDGAKPYIVVKIGSTEYLFETNASKALSELGATISVSGLPIAMMNSQIQVFSRITAPDDFVFETNPYTFKVTDLLSASDESDSKPAAFLSMIEEAQNSSEEFNMDFSVASAGASTYTSAKFNVSTGVVSIERAAFSDEAWSEVLAAAKKDGAKPYIVVKIGSTEYLFETNASKALSALGATISVSGLPVSMFNNEISVYSRITYSGSSEEAYETNAITFNLHTELMTATSSSFAQLYQTFNNN